MTEIFDELAVIVEPISDENKVVYLLAGLPESYDVLVTALESGSDTVTRPGERDRALAERRAEAQG